MQYKGIERLEDKLGLPNKFLKLLPGHVLQNNHKTCADLNSKTREAIKQHYAMDYCFFYYESRPVFDTETCIGITNNKKSMTLQFQECKLKLGWDDQKQVKVLEKSALQ